MKTLWKILPVFVVNAALAGGQGDIMTNYYPEEKNAIELYQKMSPLVVFIYNEKTLKTHYKEDYNYKVALGSGWYWDQNGYIITNNHVIEGANLLKVTLNPGKIVIASVVGAAPSRDIAVLKLPSEVKVSDFMPYEHMPIADSDELVVGQRTMAIGNPYGFDRTLTSGVVSALARQVPEEGGADGVTLRDLIQTDAAINPGNSGGPLFDNHGHVIGMNTLGGMSGIGFAIPANSIRRTVDQLINYGKIEDVGIGIHRFNDKVAQELGIQGVIIAEVTEDSSAEKAGLKGSSFDAKGNIVVGDVIVAINDEPINNYEDMYTVLDKIGGDKKIQLTVIRAGQKQKFEVTTVDFAK